jgi:predicted transcriptional regulator
MSSKNRQGKRKLREEEMFKRITTVAEMYYRKGLSQKQIALTLGYSFTEVSRLLKRAQEYNIVEFKVKTESNDESVQLSFDFPKEVRVACEQYLLYFGQFLSDLGVHADTAITHEAGKVLFTVTPTDRETALEKIREALHTYLQLPSQPLSDSEGESFEILNLRAEIYQLHSKLSLAAAKLETKDATIEAKQQTIEVLRLLKTGQIVAAPGKVIESTEFESIPTPSDDLEPVIEGYISATTIEKYGVKLHLPAIIRRLKILLTK